MVMGKKRLRFALVGTGDFGQFFARYIMEVADLVAVCDPSSQSRARFFEKTGTNVPGFSTIEQLFDGPEVDGVVLASPNHTHKPLTLAAAQRGKHVFCEKAMALTVPECWEMVRACEKTGVRL